MNKILNWTFGACFRTLGRFLAIFIVGVLLIFIGSKIGIELPDWLTLRVYAADLYGFSPGWADNLNNLGRVDYKECSSANSCNTIKEVYIDYFENSYGVRSFITNDSWTMSIGQNGYVLESPVGTLKKDYLYNIEYYVCSNKNFTNVVPEIYATDYATAINPGNIYNNVTRSNLSTQPFIDSDRSWHVCYMFSGLVVPETDYTWSALRLRSDGTTTYGVNVSTIAVNVKELGIYSSALENIIQNSGFATSESVEEVQDSVNQVQQEIQQTQDTITDDSTQGAEDSAGGFFDGFQSEDFGLSSIVTAPLRGINAMLNDTCVAPSATYKGQSFSLPCGSMLWNRPGGQDFKSFINVMYGGFLAYLVIRKFFLDVENLKNPDNDKVEVDKL